MSLHVFANFVTPYGTAANNRGDNQGSNVTPLQKLNWCGEPHTTVSAEAIRFAFRRMLKNAGHQCNRNWAEHPSEIPEAVMAQLVAAYRGNVTTPCGYFVDPEFAWYKDPASTKYADDDLLGFMSAEAGKEEAEATGVESQDEESVEEAPKGNKGKAKLKGTNYVRRSVLEVTRAVSLTPWAGEVSFNVASIGATPSAQKKGSNPVPYGTELHATRFQYGIALTPERLRDKTRAAAAIKLLAALGTVAGNHGRFLFDFSPDAVVFRVTDDPAPRLLYCFGTPDNGRTITADGLVTKIVSGDIKPKELIVGLGDCGSELAKQLKSLGVPSVVGVVDAANAAAEAINKRLGKKE